MDLFEKQLPRAIQLAHILIKSRLSAGDLAIDATVGNGHDTLFLAKLVGEKGRVIGFDIQESAIKNTVNKTTDLPQVTLHHAGHERLSEFVPDPIKAAMFNLGYLPGAGKAIITEPQTTLTALNAVSEQLIVNGMVTVVLYTGHEGGPEEASAVKKWAGDLDQTAFSVIEYGFLNQKNSPPTLIAIEKKT